MSELVETMWISDLAGNEKPVLSPFEIWLSRIANVWVELWKIGYPISVIAGALVLRAFTRSAGLPFPQPDGSLLVLLATVGLACFVFLAVLAVLPLTPVGFAYFDDNLAKLRSARIGVRPTRGHFRICLRRFLMLFGGYIASTIAFPLAVSVAFLLKPEFNNNKEAS